MSSGLMTPYTRRMYHTKYKQSQSYMIRTTSGAYHLQAFRIQYLSQSPAKLIGDIKKYNASGYKPSYGPAVELYLPPTERGETASAPEHANAPRGTTREHLSPRLTQDAPVHGKSKHHTTIHSFTHQTHGGIPVNHL